MNEFFKILIMLVQVVDLHWYRYSLSYTVYGTSSPSYRHDLIVSAVQVPGVGKVEKRTLERQVAHHRGNICRERVQNKFLF